MAPAGAGELEAAAGDPLDLLGPVLHRVVRGPVVADAALSVVEAADEFAHDQQVERARRAAEHDAQVLREQRMRREAQARREADERERVQRQQQDREEQLRQERARLRPDLRDPQRPPPEVWQRGIPILNPGPTS